jgi:serine/threonine protein kinase
VVTPAASDGLVSARYRLGDLLGTGGSASVFEAVDVRDGSVVALKLLHPHLAHDADARAALAGEAAAAGRVRHPNVVAVLGVSEPDDPLAWIALELVRGVSLAEQVDLHGPLAVPEALAVARAVLGALTAVHTAGIVHRDVSPSNIIVVPAPDGAIDAEGVRLVDFGLADAAGRSALVGDDDGASGVVGNSNYLSPEQAEGGEIDARGDVYQLGAVLYFALTGQAPFPRSTVAETMRAHLSAPPPVPSLRRGGVSRGIDRLVVKAMLKHPDARFPTAGAMMAALDALVPAAGPAEPRTLLLGAPSPLSRTAVMRDETTRLRAVRQPSLAPTRAVPVTPPTTSPPAPEPPPEPRSPVWAILGAITVVVAVVAWILSATAVPPARDAEALPAGFPTAVVSPSSTPSPVAVDTQPVVTVAVPDVAGGTVVAAAVLLDRAGLAIGSVADESSRAPAGTVLRSSPEASSQQVPGTTVDVVVASGSNTVPPVAGLTRDAAAAAVQDAGLTPLFAEETEPILPGGTVVRTDPAEATAVVLGRPVTIIVAVPPVSAPTPTPTAPPTGAPTP